MRKILILFIVGMLFSCTDKPKQNVKKQTMKRYITKDNFFRGFLFSEIKKSMSLSDFEISKVDTDSIIFHQEVDPIENIYGSPLGNDTILYFVTYSAGSGAYKQILPFWIQGNRKVEYVKFPPVTETDYMGHDSILMKNGKIYRSFPTYKHNDTNVKPTGKVKTLIYKPEIINDSLFFKIELP
ncbi:hypothetical protein [Aureivirga sp. CE67]|uniref:hypothetical protein n=1 Tax=Aureivirga sp. CE67 TaxID=1788983 RepID=UPI0018CA44AC|nr:hypothetical protein [Aureivirga sp. CE67]